MNDDAFSGAFCKVVIFLGPVISLMVSCGSSADVNSSPSSEASRKYGVNYSFRQFGIDHSFVKECGYDLLH